MNIALIGCGNIGGTIASSMKQLGGKMVLAAVYDIDKKTAENVAKKITPKPKVYGSVDELLKNEAVDLVVEAASQEAVKAYGKKIVESGKHLMVLSVGAFTDEKLYNEMKALAEKNNLKIYIPSGAIAGIDGVKSAHMGEIDGVSIVTRKNPVSLGIKTDKETILYDGPAREGIRKYPKNVNVAATLSLAGFGFDKTKLTIVADPKVDKNNHLIEITGNFGTIKVQIENHPSKDNPKTSYLAIFSALATLKKITDPVQIGT
jgi:aspartate dehydrogenase